MFRNLFNGVSLSALMLHSPDDGGADDRAALRAKLAGNVKVEAKSEAELAASENNEEENKEEEVIEEENKEEENKEEEEENKEEETEEQKKEREAAAKEAAKAQRKQDRVQRRIDEITAAKNAAEAEVARLKAQLEANPDQKLTAEEVEAKAEALAAKRIADKELADLNTKFQNACDNLQKEAKKVDKDFDAKINDVAEQFGPIPSFMIGVLEDFDNGGEVLAYIANDDDIAEEIWSYKNRPAKLTKELVIISNKLADAKKPKPKALSKVPDPPSQVKGSRVNSTVITENDTKPANMDNYIQKRIAMKEAQKKVRGY